MGFLARVKHITNPRSQGSGGLWDNVNNGNVSKGPALRTMGTNGSVTNSPINAASAGPNVEPYLKSGFRANPFRLHTAANTMLPEVPTREPRGDLWMTGYNDPQQNGSSGQVTVLPVNPLMPGVTFAPTQVRQRETLYDGANPAVVRTPQAYTDTQRYYNQMAAIPEYTTPSRRVNGVYTMPSVMQRGWFQSLVPEPGERRNQVGIAPPYLLSTPLQVKTKNTSAQSGHRSAITSAVAPKRKRSGG